MKKKMCKRILSLISATLVLTASVSFSSCSKSGDSTADSTNAADGEAIEKVSVLTGVYSESVLEVPDGYGYTSGSQPSYDTENGELRLLLSKYDTEFDESGNFVNGGYSYAICRYDKDLKLTYTKQLMMSDNENTYIDKACLVGNILYYIDEAYDSKTYASTYCICKYDLTTDEIVKSNDISGMFSTSADSDWFYIQYFTCDTEGNIYIAADSEIIVVSPDFMLKASVPLSGWVMSMSSSTDGNVYVASYFNDGYGFAKLDLTSQSLGEPTYFNNNSVNEIFFADGYDYYYTMSDGIYGCTVSDDGTVTDEILLNYTNSDISSSNFNVCAIINKDMILGTDYSAIGDAPHVYTKSDDIDLSNVTVIEIAISEYTDYSNIVNYNKSHKDTRIVLTDYTKYNTDIDYSAGTTKLVNDIASGLYKPDIVISSYSYGAASDLVSKGLFVDLNTYLSSDSELKKDDILDSVLRAFSTSDGKLWGLTSSINVKTLAAKTDTLNGLTSWTLDEMLDYAASLPEGTSLVYGLTQSNVLSYFSDSFNSFIDLENNTCDFENETFYKLLNFIAALPEDFDYTSQSDDNNYYAQYQNGSVALYNSYNYSIPSFIELQCVFNTEDYTLIGYPTTGENTRGGAIAADSTYLITSCSENPDTAWDFIKSAITVENEYSDGIPVIKSQIEEQCEKYYDYEFEFYFSGGSSYGIKDSENPRTQDDMTDPGIFTYFTEDDTAVIMDYLNNECGSPMTQAIPAEVTNIITEEITSFTGGAKNAEDCARIIQSRVKIWLSEHE